MGVFKLWELVARSGQHTTIESLADKRLAIDTSVWLHRFIKALQEEGSMPSTYLKIFFMRICKLLFFGVRPVFIFDGGVPVIKRRIINERRDRRERMQDNLTAAERKLLLLNALKRQQAGGEDSQGAEPTYSKTRTQLEEEIRMLTDTPLNISAIRDIDHSSLGDDDEVDLTNDNEESDSFSLTDELEDSSGMFADLSGGSRVKDEIFADLYEAGESRGQATSRVVDERAYQDLDALDYNSASFKTLPHEMQLELLTQAKDREMIMKRIASVEPEAVNNPNQFSHLQVKKLIRGSKLTRAINNIRDVMSHERQTIASDHSTQFILHRFNKNKDNEMDEDHGDGDGLDDDGDDTLGGFIVGDDEEIEIHPDDEDDGLTKAAYSAGGFIIDDNDEDEEEEIRLVDKRRSRAPASPSPSPSISRSSAPLVSPIAPKTASRTRATSENMGKDEPYHDFIHVSFDPDDIDEDDIFDESMFEPCGEDGLPPQPTHPREQEEKKGKGKGKERERDNVDTIGKGKGKEKKAEEVIGKDKQKEQPSSTNKGEEREKGKGRESDILSRGKSASKAATVVYDISDDDDEVVTASSSSSSSLPSATPPQSHPSDLGAQDASRPSRRTVIDIHDEEEDDIQAAIEASLRSGGGASSSSSVSVPSPSREEEEVRAAIQAAADAQAQLNAHHRPSSPDVVIGEGSRSSGFPEVDRMELDLQLEKAAQQQLHARHQARQVQSVSDEMVVACQEMLTLFGIPYVTAPMEAEAQCAYLNSCGLVDGVVTDDSDVFLFGASTVYRNLFDPRKFVERYRASEIKEKVGLDRDGLISFALLLGSDYTLGVHGIGLVNAIELLNEFHTLENFKAWVLNPDLFDSQQSQGSDASQGSQSASQDTGTSPAKPTTTPLKRHLKKMRERLKEELRGDFPSPTVVQAYLDPMVDQSQEPFVWACPDLDDLRKFAREKFGWSVEKADEQLLPVVKKFNQRRVVPGNPGQQRIDTFFPGITLHPNDVHIPTRNKSKRLGNALLRLTGQPIPTPPVEAKKKKAPKKAGPGDATPAPAPAPAPAPVSAAPGPPPKKAPARKRKTAASQRSDDEYETPDPQKAKK